MESPRGFDKNGSVLFFFRKRRFVLILVALVELLLFVFRSGQQRTNGLLTRWSGGQVEEIYGFLHVVLNDNEDGLHSSDLRLDTESDNHISQYDPEYSTVQWSKERTRINQEHPLIVFSKSYCQYSKRAKHLLALLDLQPPPKIIEVDLREDDQDIKKFLTRLTRHSTFPNILVHGKSIGGSDDLAQLHGENKLTPLLLKAGVKPNEAESFES